MSSTFPLWEKIFAAKNFDLSQDLHYITADEIKALTGAEPRILAKMDSSAVVPPVLRRNGYFLLPVRNGKYAIVRGEGFHRLEATATEAENHTSRIKFNLTTAGRGSSEMQYLDYSFNTGAIEAVLGISPLYQSIRGREFSREFRFRVNKTELEAASVQLEVDSGLEGEDAIVLIEAKMSTPEDFIIRQLFYPYSHFSMVSPTKTIIPVFFTYEPTPRRYNFWIYEFADPRDYNSIALKSVRSISINTAHEIQLSDIRPKGLVAYKRLIPQANDFAKLIEMVFKVNEGINNYRSVAEYFQFDERQSSYYREAAEALGLVVSWEGKYQLTETGKTLVDLPAENRNMFIIELLTDFTLIKRSVEILNDKGQLSKEDLQGIIAQESSLTGSTLSRRASSLISWLKWMGKASGSFTFEAGRFKRA